MHNIELTFHLWFIIGVMVISVVWQLKLLWRFNGRNERQMEILDSVEDQSVELITAQYTEFPWLDWVLDRYSSVAISAQTLDREKVLNELDWHIESDRTYSRLQSMASYGPLIGVLLTTLGFLLLQLPQMNDIKISSVVLILFSGIRPLSLGMGAGVLIALLNSELVQRATVSSDNLRAKARIWYDKAIADEFAKRPGQEFVLNQFADNFGSATDRIEESNRFVAVQIESLGNFSEQLETTITPLLDELRMLPKAIEESTVANESLANAAKGLLDSSTSVVESLEKTATQLATVINDDVVSATASFRESSEGISRQISELEESGRRLTNATEKQIELFATVENTVKDKILNAHESFHDTLTELVETMSGLSEPASALSGSMSDVATTIAATTDSIEETKARFNDSITRFSDAIDVLTPASHQYSEIMQLGQTEYAELNKAVNLITTNSSELLNIAGRYHTDLDQIEELLQAIAASITETTESSATLREAILLGLGQSQVELTSAITSMRDSASQLAECTKETVGPGKEAFDALTSSTANLSNALEQYRPLTQTTSLIDTLVRLEKRLLELPAELKLHARKMDVSVPQKSSGFFGWRAKEQTVSQSNLVTRKKG